MTKKLKLGLTILFLLQIIIASGFELAHDEAYYWIFSKNLDWGYFDHPPLMALTIKTFSFLPKSELTVRLGFILMQFGALILLMRLLPKNYWSRTTLLFFAFPLASFSGFLALPDMPLLFMTAVYCVYLKRYLEKGNELSSIVLMGICIPILLYAKYHGILLIFFTIIAVPKLLKRKNFYLVAIISILLFLPHVWWQYKHDFSTLRYHFLERPTSSFSLKRSLDYIITQIALAGVLVGPIVWWITLKFKSRNDFDRSMKMISIGVVIFFFLSSFSKRVEANWTIFLTIPLIYLTVRSDIWEKKWVKYLLGISFFIVMTARLLLVLPDNIVKIKRLNEFHGWKDWASVMKDKCGKGKLLANTYQVASKLSFYLDEDIQSLNFHSRKNQFDYWRFDKEYKAGKVCYITDKPEFTGEVIMTPDGKKLGFVTDMTLSELRNLKFKNIAI